MIAWRTVGQILSNLSFHGVEKVNDQENDSSNPKMAGKEEGLGPVDNLRAEGDRHKQPVQRATVQHIVSQSLAISFSIPHVIAPSNERKASSWRGEKIEE